MNLLFDQNLSPYLVQKLKDIFPNAAHVSNLEMETASDLDIWNYAKKNNFVIVTKDADFYDKRILTGEPPNIIWIRRGNCSTKTIESLLRNAYHAIMELDKGNESVVTLL